jgi:hypothetical protein
LPPIWKGLAGGAAGVGGAPGIVCPNGSTIVCPSGSTAAGMSTVGATRGVPGIVVAIGLTPGAAGMFGIVVAIGLIPAPPPPSDMADIVSAKGLTSDAAPAPAAACAG